MVRWLGLQSHLEQVAGAGFPENLPGHSLLSFPHMSGILALQLDPSSATLILTVERWEGNRSFSLRPAHSHSHVHAQHNPG